MFSASISTNHMEAIDQLKNALLISQSFSSNFSLWEKVKKVAAVNPILIYSSNIFYFSCFSRYFSRSLAVGFTSSSRWSFIWSLSDDSEQVPEDWSVIARWNLESHTEKDYSSVWDYDVKIGFRLPAPVNVEFKNLKPVVKIWKIKIQMDSFQIIIYL